MQLKHLNLTTSDVSGLAAFFERFFGFKRLLERGSGAFTILSNNEDFVLTLMKAKKHDPVGYPETFHVGFYLDNPAAVQTKHDVFAEAGLSPGEIHCADHNGRGTHFYCTAPGNVLVEIATPPKLSQLRGRLGWRPHSFQTKRAMSAHGPSATSLDVRCLVANGGKADEAQTGQNRRS